LFWSCVFSHPAFVEITELFPLHLLITTNGQKWLPNMATSTLCDLSGDHLWPNQRATSVHVIWIETLWSCLGRKDMIALSATFSSWVLPMRP
jgi:hypothetical protein